MEEQYEQPPEDEDVREGEDDMPASHSRKRSAKGVKRTKAPMEDADGSCSCGASSGKRKKCSCDGGCGSKKMDEALTAQEYLDACDLGIQDRSLPYIRTRLMVTEQLNAEREDAKCGRGAISAGERCTKGNGSAVGSNPAFNTQSGRPSIRKYAGQGAKLLGAAGAGYGLGAGLMINGGGGWKRRVAGGLINAGVHGLSNAAQGALIGAGVGAVARGTHAMRNRNKNRNRRASDSVWADGFEPHMDAPSTAPQKPRSTLNRAIGTTLAGSNLIAGAANIAGAVGSARRGRFGRAAEHASLAVGQISGARSFAKGKYKQGFGRTYAGLGGAAAIGAVNAAGRRGAFRGVTSRVSNAASRFRTRRGSVTVKARTVPNRPPSLMGG